MARHDIAKESLTAVLSGPFFTKDPRLTFRQNLRTMLEALASEGERSVKQILAGGESGRAPIARLPGHRVSEYVIGRVRALSGKRWAVTAVVSVNNSRFTPTEGISLMAAGSRVESQTHAFRRVASAMRSSRAVLAANLTEGLE